MILQFAICGGLQFIQIMKALVFHHPGKVSVDNVPDPKIEKSDDVILRVTSTAICGSDLHIYNGFFPQKKDMVLGHEFMGIPPKDQKHHCGEKEQAAGTL